MKNWKSWLHAAAVRAVKTVAQTAVATIGTSAVLGRHGTGSWWPRPPLWRGILSLLTSVAGLPELKTENRGGDAGMKIAIRRAGQHKRKALPCQYRLQRDPGVVAEQPGGRLCATAWRQRASTPCGWMTSPARTNLPPPPPPTPPTAPPCPLHLHSPPPRPPPGGAGGGGAGGGLCLLRPAQRGKRHPPGQHLQRYHRRLRQVRQPGQPAGQLHLYVLRKTNMPAVLVECGFMDSTADTPLILTDDFARKCAEGIARGICVTAGIAYNGGGITTTEPAPLPLPSLPRLRRSRTPTPGTATRPSSRRGSMRPMGPRWTWTASGAARPARRPSGPSRPNSTPSSGRGWMDGLWGPKTRAACVNVRQGAKGNLTRIIQGRLYCMGYDPNGFDGSFGPGCAAAVRAFQTARGLSADGIVGRNTWAALLG